jgi:NADPH-dependent 2,4-dienoyl-CoA reductase/sulfur reductase-like enzyme
VIETELAIVGAGPAGLAAAAAALAGGLSVTLLDDNPTPGGQYFRQPPPALRSAMSRPDDAEHRRAEELFRALTHPRMLHLAGAVVWDAPEPRVLAFTRGGESGRVRAAAIVLATGAVERPVPFPGWTLPGVLSAGGLQNLVKGQRILPGRRFLVAGNGPLLLVAAQSILDAGGTVVEVLEAAPAASGWYRLPALAMAPDLLRRGLAYRLALRRAGVPLRSGHTIVEARGADEVTEALVAPIDARGAVDGTRLRRVSVDTVVAGFGLVPSVELARLLGARHRWDSSRGGLAPERSEHFETSVPSVFAVGDGAGIGGSEVALAEGELVGLLAAARLGRGEGPRTARATRRLRTRLGRLYRVRDTITSLWTPPATFSELITADTVVCRCEDVTAGEVTRLAEENDGSLDALKATSRVTMGRCQGRNCLASVAEIVARARGVPVRDLALPRARPPARPIRLGDLLHEPLPVPRVDSTNTVQ